MHIGATDNVRVMLEPRAVEASSFTPEEKVALFHRLFRAHRCIPIRWENKAGKAGYALACANDDFVACKGEQGAKEAGKMQPEGKEYVVWDGDVTSFRFNV